MSLTIIGIRWLMLPRVIVKLKVNGQRNKSSDRCSNRHLRIVRSDYSSTLKCGTLWRKLLEENITAGTRHRNRKANQHNRVNLRQPMSKHSSKKDTLLLMN